MQLLERIIEILMGQFSDTEKNAGSGYKYKVTIGDNHKATLRREQRSLCAVHPHQQYLICHHYEIALK